MGNETGIIDVPAMMREFADSFERSNGNHVSKGAFMFVCSLPADANGKIRSSVATDGEIPAPVAMYSFAKAMEDAYDDFYGNFEARAGNA